MYIPSDYIKEYFEKNGEFTVTEEEIIKFSEILSVLVSIKSKAEDSDFPSVRPPVSSLKTQEHRKSICNRCPEFIKKDASCGLCGCVISDKVIDPGAKCPALRWSVEMEFFIDEISKLANFIDLKLKTAQKQNNLVYLSEHERRVNKSLSPESNE